MKYTSVCSCLRVVRYHELSLTSRLREALGRKVIIEFPTLLVVTESELHAFPLLQPDESGWVTDSMLQKRPPRAQQDQPLQPAKELSSAEIDALRSYLCADE
eukprot:m.274223 g.274223  ORF g.274223 m.274223 type:complete len:102 (-) comp54828_c0_seq14:79-384(-)